MEKFDSMRTETNRPKLSKAEWMQRRKRQKKRKLLFIAFLVLFALIVMGILSASLRSCAQSKAEIPEEQKWQVKYRPSFDIYFEENIFDDKEYMAMDRDIKYIEGAQSTAIALDEDANVGAGNIAFFQSYLTCIIEGRYEDYNAYFHESYFDKENEGLNYPYPTDRFPMQKLFNISLEYLPMEEAVISENESRSYYILKYMIKHNTSTFRPELEDYSTVAQLVELYTVDGKTKITKLLKYITN